jgi:hypothetical protein
MGGACGTHGGKEMPTLFWMEIYGKGLLEDKGIDGRVVELKKKDRKKWI